MAWNGSDSKVKVGGQGQGRGGKYHHSTLNTQRSTLKRGALAGLIVVALGGAAVWWFVGRPDAPAPADKIEKARPSRITAVTPHIATNAVAEEEVPVKKEVPFWKVDASKTNGFSDVMIRKWKAAHRPPPAYTNDSSRHIPPPKYAIFKYHSENEIACLLTMTPGETLVGTPTYRGYTKDFLKSCEEPIVISEEDDEETRNLKRMMNETKIELRQRMADGEKLEDILSETRSEYQQLASYKSMLDDEFRKFAKDPENSDRDVDDFLKAANQMLEQKGIAPLKLGIITKRRLQSLKQEQVKKGE